MDNDKRYPLQWPVGWKRTSYAQRSSFDRDRSFAIVAELLGEKGGT